LRGFRGAPDGAIRSDFLDQCQADSEDELIAAAADEALSMMEPEFEEEEEDEDEEDDEEGD
jgi:hypothetical protein